MRSLTYPTLLLVSLAAACGLPGAPGTGDATPGDDASGGPPPFTNGTSTLAGSEQAAYVDGPRDLARFANPVNVAYHGGKIYVADFDNGKLRVVDPDGTSGTIISQVGFARPFGMTFTTNGTMYVSTDKDANGQLNDMSGSIWRIDLAARKAVVIAANLGRPRGLCALPDGRLAVADYTHHAIQIFDPASAKMTPLAGQWGISGMVDGVAAAAKFSQPYQLVLGTDGALIVTDFNNSRLRRVALDGTVTTLAGATAGFSDGTMAAAKFDHPKGIAIDAAGDLYISDTVNARIRRVHAGLVQTIAGDGTPGYVDNDDNLAARFYGLEGLSVSPDGTAVYVADGTQGGDVPYNRVRYVKP